MSLTIDVLLDAALQYAADGFAVFPVYRPIINKNGVFCSCIQSDDCPDIGKHPHYDKELIPHGVLNATTDPYKIRIWWEKWPNANIGIATGAISQLFVCDADSPIIVNDAEHRGLPPTRRVRTGNGQHAWFKHPGYKVPNKVKIEGFDFRGDGGYVVAPPSLHYTGKHYEWLTADDIPLADCPDWVADLISQSPEYVPSVAVKVAEFDTRYGLMALKKEVARIENASNGSRNDTFYQSTASLYNLVAGGELLDNTVAYAVIEAAHSVGLLNGETHKTFESAKRNGLLNPRAAPKAINPKPNIDLLTFSDTDTGNAERIVALYGDSIHYVSAWDTWVFWNGQYWQKDDIGFIARLVKTMIQLLKAQTMDMSDDEKELRLKRIRFALSAHSRKSIDNMLHLAKNEVDVRIHTNMFDTDPWLLNVQNGTINLRTGNLQPHKQTDLITKMLDITYDPKAIAPRWMEFLNTIFSNDQELIKYIQRAVGYSCTGDTGEDCLHFAFGAGGNGKSTFFSVIERLLGEYAHKTPASMLMAQKFEGIPVDTAALQGKRFVVASEISKNVRWNEAKIKDLTGGDRLTARYMRQNPFSFDPSHKLWIYGNYKPLVIGSDDGIWRRMRLIAFAQKLPGDIKNFERRLFPELSGILNWAIAGCLDWAAHGLGMPPAINQATQDYRKEMDKLQAFIEDYCIEGEKEKCILKDLYAVYSHHCKEHNEYCVDKHEFQERLERKAQYTVKRGTGNKPYIFGLRYLKATELVAERNKAIEELATMEIT